MTIVKMNCNASSRWVLGNHLEATFEVERSRRRAVVLHLWSLLRLYSVGARATVGSIVTLHRPQTRCEVGSGRCFGK